MQGGILEIEQTGFNRELEISIIRFGFLYLKAKCLRKTRPHQEESKSKAAPYSSA